MNKPDYNYKYDSIHWQKTIDDVNKRFFALQACWKATEQRKPELHKKFVSDLYMPALMCLAQFCEAVRLGEEPEDVVR